MAQQTAVDWYAKEHHRLLIQLESKELSLGEYVVKHQDILKQAKQMEREQIKEAFDYGDYCIDLPDGGWEQKYKSAEQYYNETYGK